MCRMAAYLGPSIALQAFLTDPEHSLVVQSWAPRELKYAKLNADGFGVGWYADDETPATYTNPMPIWSDPNLQPLGRSLSREIWLANVRSATAGLPVNHANTQPFHDQELLFMHNGFLDDFPGSWRPAIQEMLSVEIAAQIQGNTDSEYIYALLRHLMEDDDELSLEDAIDESLALLDQWAGDLPALLNLIVADGERLCAVRHAVNHECPSLYYTTDDDSFPGGQLIASEPLTDSEYWQPVPEHHMLVLDPHEPPELMAL